MHLLFPGSKPVTEFNPFLIFQDHYILDLIGNQALSIGPPGQYWTVNGISNPNQIKSYECNGVYYIGGFGILNVGDYLERTYDSLPSHDMISYYVRFLTIDTDNWQSSEKITISFNDTNHIFSFAPSGIGPADRSSTSHCGDSTFADDDFVMIEGKFFHNVSTLTVRIYSNLANNARSYALRGIRFALRQKTPTDTQKSCVKLFYPELSSTFSERCDCPRGYYLNSANSCQPCHATCFSCYGPTSNDCYLCAGSHSFDGQECVRCTANCDLCSGSSYNQCHLCSTSYILGPDYTCQNACNAPYSLVNMGEYKICTKTSCQLNGTFLYPNGTCISDCPVPYKQRIEGMNKYCDKPCANNLDFWKFNNNSTSGACIQNCLSPYKVRTDGTIKICDNPCTNNSEFWRYENSSGGGSCIQNCSSPYNVRTDGTINYCDKPCANDLQFWKFNNNSTSGACIENCSSPYKVRTDGIIKICDNPCTNNSEFWRYDNSSAGGTCIQNCLLPYKVRTDGTIKFCDKPCANDFDFWKYDYNSTNGSCISDCAPPYKVKTDGLIKICERPCDNLLEYYYEDKQICKLGCDYPYKKIDNAICIKDLSSQDLDQIKAIGGALNATGTAKSYVGTTVSLINFANPAAFFLEAMSNMLKYIRYMKITYPPKLQAILDMDLEAPIDVIPRIPEKIVETLPAQPLPEKFEQYELHSSFIYNFWNSSIILMVILVSIILSSILEKLSRRYRSFNSYFVKLKDALKWNFFLGYFTSLIGEIVLCTFFQIQTLSLSTAISIIDLSTCILWNLITFTVLVRMVYIVLKFRRLINQSTKSNNQATSRKFFSSYEVILEPYKQKLLIQQVCMCIFIVRSYLFNLVIAYLFNHPLVQAAMITGLSILMVLYLAIFRPYKQILDLIQYLLQEVVVLVVNICVLVLAIFDASNNQDLEKRRVLGDMVIYMNLVFSMIGTLYLVFQLIKIVINLVTIIRKYLQNYRLKDKLKKSTRLYQFQRSRLPNEHKDLNDKLDQNSYQDSPTIKLSFNEKHKRKSPEKQNKSNSIASTTNVTFQSKNINHELIEDKAFRNIKIYQPTRFKQARKKTRQSK